MILAWSKVCSSLFACLTGCCTPLGHVLGIALTFAFHSPVGAHGIQVQTRTQDLGLHVGFSFEIDLRVHQLLYDLLARLGIGGNLCHSSMTAHTAFATLAAIYQHKLWIFRAFPPLTPIRASRVGIFTPQVFSVSALLCEAVKCGLIFCCGETFTHG